MDTRSSLQNAIAGITLRQLQYFIAVAEEEHFTRASERLVIAQPALSRQVSDLEDALGVSLFVRAARGIRLTDAGRELLARARVLFNVLEHTVEAVRLTANEGSGRLRLGYYGPSFYNNEITRSALERFRAEAPDVDVVSHELFSEQLVSALREGRIDLGISRGAVRASDIDVRVIATERAIVLLPETDALAREPDVAVAELDGRPLIAFQNALSVGLNERVAEIAAMANVSLRIVQEVNQLPSIAYHVARNDGIAILPASSGGFPYPGVAVRALRDPFATIDLTAVTRRGEDAPHVRRFLALLDAGAGDGIA